MQCPICGRENTPENKKCSHCGTNFRVYRASIKALKRKETPKKRSYAWTKWIAACLALLILAGFVRLTFPWQQAETSVPKLTPPAPPTTMPHTTSIPFPTPTTAPSIPPVPPETPLEHVAVTDHISIVNKDGLITYNQSLLDTASYGKIQKSSQSSLDGSAMAVLTTDKKLYLVKDYVALMIASGVVDFKLSAMGTGVAYTTQQPRGKNLCIYSYQLDQSYQIVPPQEIAPEYCISPDGKCLAYRAFDETASQYSLFLWSGNQSSFVSSSWANLIAVSNEGSHIYTEFLSSDGGNQLFCYTNGSRYYLGNSTSRYCLNADHSQLLFQQKAHTYICFDGETAKEFASFSAEPILPVNAIYRTESISGGSCTTYPFYGFYNRPYFSTLTNSINYVSDQADETYTLVKEPDAFYLNASGTGVFYAMGDVLFFTKAEAYYPGKFASPIFGSYRPGSLRLSPVNHEVFAHISGENLVLTAPAKDGSILLSQIVLENIADNEEITFAFGENGQLYYIRDQKLYMYFEDVTTLIWEINVRNLSTKPNGIVFVEASGYHCILADSGLIFTTAVMPPMAQPVPES